MDCKFVAVFTLIELGTDSLCDFIGLKMQNFKMKTLTNSIDNKEQFNIYNTNFEGFDILTFKHCNSDELFFIGKQCAEMLEYNDTAQAIRTNISDEDKCKLEYDYCMELLKLISNNINGLDDSSRNSFRPGVSPGLKENRDNSSNSLNSKENNGIYCFSKNGATFISEEGFYDLIFDSKKLEAKQFRKTVHKILKEIRTTGGYNLDKVPAIDNTQLDNISKYMETNSDSMTVMAQLLDSNLTMNNRIQDIINLMIHAKVGSYTEALLLNPHSAVVSDRKSVPTKNWSNNTTCWSAIVNLGVYAHTQKTVNSDNIKSLYTRMDSFETDINTFVKTSQIEIAAKFNKVVTNFKTMHNNDINDLKTMHNKDINDLKSMHNKDINDLKTMHNSDINDLKSEHNADINDLKSEMAIAKLDRANKQLNTKFKTTILPNFRSLSEKINALKEAISILKLSK